MFIKPLFFSYYCKKNINGVINMSSNTKIVVLRSKEVVYALVLLFVVALIIAVAISLFMPAQNNTGNNVPTTKNQEENTQNQESTEDSSSTATASLYIPGVYTSTLQLGNTNLELQITVDKDHINSITFANIDESVTTMYPLMEPSLNELSTQIISNQSIENINYSDENRYTSMLLMQAITETLEIAKVSENSNSFENSIYDKEIN